MRQGVYGSDRGGPDVRGVPLRVPVRCSATVLQRGLRERRYRRGQLRHLRPDLLVVGSRDDHLQRGGLRDPVRRRLRRVQQPLRGHVIGQGELRLLREQMHGQSDLRRGHLHVPGLSSPSQNSVISRVRTQ